MMGALIGMILVLGLYTVQFLLDDTFKSADDIEREFGVIPLTVIPEGKISGFEPAEKTKRGRRKKGSK
jgi:capsular polysaccharide biosynthesis protein